MSHYNVFDESECRIAAERQNLSNLFYKNKMTLNFEAFSTNMKANFDTMEKYGEGRSNIDKFNTLLEKISTKNQKLEYAITFCRSNNNGNYLSETNYIASQIIFIFPAQQPSQ